MKAISSLLLLAATFVTVGSVPVAEPIPVTDASLIKLKARQYSTSTTQNQLIDGTPCRAVTIIFARGTLESGNVGTLVGPPFFQAVADAIGSSNLAVQGVDYPADIAGFLAGGDAGGSRNMSNWVQTAGTRCPNTKIVMSGYSQGGQLVHNAAKQLSSSAAAKVNSVVIFGDPDDGQAVANIPASKVKVFCHDTDNICDGGIAILPSHLDYALDATAAAAFVKSQAGL